MARFTKIEKWAQWTGTLSDIATGIEIATRELSALPDATVVTPLLKIFARDFDEVVPDIGKLKEANERDVRHIESVRSAIVSSGGPTIRIEIKRSRPALSITAQGESIAQLRGVLGELKTHFDRGARLRNSDWLLAVPLLAIPILLAVVTDIATLPYAGPDNGTRGIVVSFVPLALLLIEFGTVRWLFPILELRGPGDQTRWQRFNNGIYLAMIAVVGGAVISVAMSFSGR